MNLFTRFISRMFHRESAHEHSSSAAPRTLTHDEAIALAEREGWHLTRVSGYLTSLTVDLAHQLIDGHSAGDLDLRSVTSLTPDAAHVLTRCPGILILSGLLELPPECARQFIRFHRPLWLHGLREIPDATAEALSHHVGWLFLDGLQTLSPVAARWLARHQPVVSLGDVYNWVSLNGLTSLSDEAASALGHLPGDLSLDGIERLSTTALRGLARHRTGILSLRRLASLPDEIAPLFCSRTSIVDLSGLRDVSPEALAVLRQNPGIRLPGARPRSIDDDGDEW